MPKNSLIKIQGTQEFMNKQIPVVLGGFGEKCRVVTDKMVAEIHNMRTTDVRRRISDNIRRFNCGIDYSDLKQCVHETHTSDLVALGYSKSSITQAENIYLLSERGYAKLIKIMDTDLAWEIHDKLIDEYFQLREQQTYVHLSKELQAIFVLDHKQQEIDKRITKIENTMTIDYAQQNEIQNQVAKRIISLLGGSDSPGYKNRTVSSKAFKELYRELKRMFQVNSYRNIAIKDFEKAKGIIPLWEPSEELALMIKGANSQLRHSTEEEGTDYGG